VLEHVGEVTGGRPALRDRGLDQAESRGSDLAGEDLVDQSGLGLPRDGHVRRQPAQRRLGAQDRGHGEQVGTG